MSLWVVRAGRYGENEQYALDHNIVTIAWNEFDDLSHIKSKEELTELYIKLNPGTKKMKIANEVGQVWRFIHEIQKNDLVALPLKMKSEIAIGKVLSDYEYKVLIPNIKHTRRVEWLKTIPRSAFDQDLLYSFGASMTVYKIERNNAENRVKKLLKGEITKVEDTSQEEEEKEEEVINIDEYAKDQIIKFIDRKFKGHNLARLVNAILKAQGFITKISPPGPDGGVDILASGGSLGFDNPKICIQVKSTSTQADVKILRDLKGTMRDLKAEQGLLVSWYGFKDTVVNEAKRDFFFIRLWDQGDLLNEIFKYYERFDDELKAELPLKRIWALIIEE
ncbi:MAG: restriction endonuclease [Ignavibacteria bacterium]|nr:restriction endonuclease [Ignavibacteria bacterium]